MSHVKVVFSPVLSVLSFVEFIKLIGSLAIGFITTSATSASCGSICRPPYQQDRASANNAAAVVFACSASPNHP